MRPANRRLPRRRVPVGFSVVHGICSAPPLSGCQPNCLVLTDHRNIRHGAQDVADTVPPDERIRAHDDEEPSPVDEPCEHDERHAGVSVQAPRLALPLDSTPVAYAGTGFSAARLACDAPGQRNKVQQIANEEEGGAAHSVRVNNSAHGRQTAPSARLRVGGAEAW